jgi:hypothetical protein
MKRIATLLFDDVRLLFRIPFTGYYVMTFNGALRIAKRDYRGRIYCTIDGGRKRIY